VSYYVDLTEVLDISLWLWLFSDFIVCSRSLSCERFRHFVVELRYYTCVHEIVSH